MGALLLLLAAGLEIGVAMGLVAEHFGAEEY